MVYNYEKQIIGSKDNHTKLKLQHNFERWCAVFHVKYIGNCTRTAHQSINIDNTPKDPWVPLKHIHILLCVSRLLNTNMNSPVLRILIFLAVMMDLGFADLASEQSSEAVFIKLYKMSESDWTSAKAESFKTVISTETTTYCTNDVSLCGLDSAIGFTNTEVQISSTSDNSKSMELTFYVAFPSGAAVTTPGDTEYILPSSALKAIIEESRDLIKDSVDVYVTLIGTEYYGIPVEKTANAIIIPVTVVTIVALAIITVALVKWQARKEKQDRINARLTEKTKYGTNSDVPNYNILETTHSTTVTTTSPRAGGNTNKVAPDNYQRFNAEKDSIGAKTMMDSEPSRNEFYSTKNGDLPPLRAEEAAEEERKKERRRQKKEKRREKRRMEGEGMEMYDNQGMDTSNLTATDSESRSNVPTFTVKQSAIA